MLVKAVPQRNVSKECVKVKLSNVPLNERVSWGRSVKSHFPNCLFNKIVIPVVL